MKKNNLHKVPGMMYVKVSLQSNLAIETNSKMGIRRRKKNRMTQWKRLAMRRAQQKRGPNRSERRACSRIPDGTQSWSETSGDQVPCVPSRPGPQAQPRPVDLYTPKSPTPHTNTTGVGEWASTSDSYCNILLNGGVYLKFRFLRATVYHPSRAVALEAETRGRRRTLIYRTRRKVGREPPELHRCHSFAGYLSF